MCRTSVRLLINSGFGFNVGLLRSRKLFSDVIHPFGPAMHAVVMNHYMQRDLQLIAEANRVITANVVGRGHRAGETYIGLSIQLELQTILYTEYRHVPRLYIDLRANPHCRRNLYFTVMNLIGDTLFNFVGDYHHQRKGVIEADAVRIEDMLKRIRSVAN